jgi:hypothetical protein
MKSIEESVETKAPTKRVWKAWSDMYHWKAAGGSKSFQKGFKGYSLQRGGKKVPFRVTNVKKGEAFTTVWKSFLVKMIFRYELKRMPKGSLITCRVKFGGFLGWAARFFLVSKVRKNLSESLNQFAEQLDLSQRQGRMKSF